MDQSTIRSGKNTCTFCQTPIKSDIETFYCPSCTSPYHKDCWLENKGCAVYGCGEKIQGDDEYSSMREAIINIEYLINKNQYSEAIYEAKQYLKIDRRNAEIKNLYNKAVALINNKINLMTSGDDAFGKKDYNAAEVYYKNVLKYTDELESNFVNTRLEIARAKIPDQKRRKIFENILIVVIILAILSAIGYLGYYTFVLKEDRDYAELVKSDNARDLKTIETMISKYENFLQTYPNGKNKVRALNRINQYSQQIAGIYYKDDWRLSLKYYRRISSFIKPDDGKTIFGNIYDIAYTEYKLKLSNAKKLNAMSKYGEALNELNNAKLIVSNFPDESVYKELNVIESNISLLNKKINSIVKSNDLEREIREQDKQLVGLSSSGNKNSVMISAKVSKFIQPNIYVGKDIASGKMLAVRSDSHGYRPGQLLSIECYGSGNISIQDDSNRSQTVQLFVPSNEFSDNGSFDLNSTEREAIHWRLRNLKSQKTKIDSLLKQNLL